MSSPPSSGRPDKPFLLSVACELFGHSNPVHYQYRGNHLSPFLRLPCLCGCVVRTLSCQSFLQRRQMRTPPSVLQGVGQSSSHYQQRSLRGHLNQTGDLALPCAVACTFDKSLECVEAGTVSQESRWESQEKWFTQRIFCSAAQPKLLNSPPGGKQ